jgi:hypothetical protein
MRPNLRTYIFLCGCFAILAGSRNLLAQASGQANGITVTLAPASFTIGISANQQLKATVSGSTNQGVTWSVNGVANGNVTFGTVDPATQLYFAPAALPSPVSYNITATSKADKTKSASATVTVLSADPLGTVSNVKLIACPGGGISGASCQQMTISCESVNNWNAYVKINTPTGTSNGVVMYGVGAGGSSLYDTAFTFGQTAVQNVLNAGFTTVQVSFGMPFTKTEPYGWMTGPGGMRRLACRYATLAQWVYTNVLNNVNKPLCATGNSGGGAAIAYALSTYGLGGIFSMVEVTSGPALARMDYGCMCNQGSAATTCGNGQLRYCYGTATAKMLDIVYAKPLCSNAVNGHPSPIASTLFLSDSIDAPGIVLAFPKTYVNNVYGGLDTSSAVPEGLLWYDQISSQKSQACVADAPHPIADVEDGAIQIANDIISLCKLQP